MKASSINQLLITAALVGTLSACSGAQTPGAEPVVTTPMESAVTPAAGVTETTEETTTEAIGEATSEAATETTIVTSTEATTGTTTGSAVTGAAETMDPAQCEAIKMAVDEALGVSTTLAESCLIMATGTGEDFGNFLDVAQSLREVFEALGWTENPAYVADSPTGTVFAYESDSQIAFVSVDWQPSEDAECPEDQPISACELEPSQQLYTITVEVAQAGQ